jgi:receptor protein-tyrosine kinase
VLITSSSPGDGKSTVAMHLASAAAGAGSSVLLIEADLRHPTLAGRLKLPGNRGLSQLLAGEFRDIDEVIQTVRVDGRNTGDGGRSLDVLVSGPIPPNPTDLIESERMRDIIQLAKRDYDLVIVDTPPTSVVSDAIPLVKEVSGVIVVCRLGKTTRESAHHLRDQLQNLEANLLGVVVNSVGRQAGYGHLYGYGYGEQPQRKRKKGDAAEPAAAPAARNGAPRPNGGAPDAERIRVTANGHAADRDEARREPSAVNVADPPAVQPARPRPAEPQPRARPEQQPQRSGGILRRRPRK